MADFGIGETIAIVGMLTAAAGTAASYAMTPKMPQMDMTNYDLLRQTQEQADAESEAAKARMEEARKREELRQQQMFASDIKTSEVGADSVGVKNQVLGKTDKKEGEEE
jgi:hypothetical protein